MVGTKLLNELSESFNITHQVGGFVANFLKMVRWISMGSPLARRKSEKICFGDISMVKAMLLFRRRSRSAKFHGSSSCSPEQGRREALRPAGMGGGSSSRRRRPEW